MNLNEVNLYYHTDYGIAKHLTIDHVEQLGIDY